MKGLCVHMSWERRGSLWPWMPAGGEIISLQCQKKYNGALLTGHQAVNFIVIFGGTSIGILAGWMVLFSTNLCREEAENDVFVLNYMSFYCFSFLFYGTFHAWAINHLIADVWVLCSPTVRSLGKSCVVQSHVASYFVAEANWDLMHGKWLRARLLW